MHIAQPPEVDCNDVASILNVNMAFFIKQINLTNNKLSLDISYKDVLHFKIPKYRYCVDDDFVRLAFKKVGLGI